MIKLWGGAFFASLLIFTSGISGNKTLQKPGKPLYKNPNEPVEARVHDLLKRMTLSEKIAQLECVWQKKSSFVSKNMTFNPKKFKQNYPHSIGQIARPGKNPFGQAKRGLSPTQEAKFTNAIQRYAINHTRLGIPILFHGESLHGYVAPDATSFPIPMALGSTWNPGLIKNVFSIAALESRSRGNDLVLAPVVNLARDPRWGRTGETYGEDPYIAYRMGLAATKGFQGSGNSTKIDSDHVMATLKHFAAFGEPQGGRNMGPTSVGRHTLNNIFLYPFREIISRTPVHSVMASYNQIDGIPSHENSWLLNHVLRDEWHYKGMVVSDYNGISDLKTLHHTEPTLEAAGVAALKAGVDTELPDPDCFTHLKNAVKQGLISTAVIDTAVSRVLRAKFQLGLFDHPYVNVQRAKEIANNPDHAQMAEKTAEQSMILLQNKGNLAPLNLKKYKKIAVIGPNANRVLLGGYSNHPRHFVTVLQGIKDYVGDKAQVNYSIGTKITKTKGWVQNKVELSDTTKDQQRIARAVKLAKKSDLVILAIGGNEQTSREAWSNQHLGDRSNLKMVGLQNKLVDALSKTGKPIVALLFNGRPLAVTNLVKKVPTIFECWYLGQETGHAVAKTLFGDVNPSGKLTITVPRSVGQLPDYYNYKPTSHRPYLFVNNKPLFNFGYGLSYTSFKFGKPSLSRSTMSRTDSVEVSVPVTNTGQRAGREVAQLYIRDEVSSVARPVKELRGFKKIDLKPGETKTVSFTITPDKLAFYNADMKYTVEPGIFDIMVGSSSRDADLKKLKLTVKN
ncbi:MAG TPA: glycoside hydrolase family 3 N-terminal domain-containing protein [Balneolaceae bacterium]|nr:glycoside hydrolase family 3 N-terminal domain-containing protein [Balneolaceae bacterium]